MNANSIFYRILSVVTLLTLLLPLSPTPSSMAQRETPPLPSASILPAWSQSGSTAPDSILNQDTQAKQRGATAQATANSNAVYVDLRDHGPDPETVVALIGQPVVWTNNGTKSHTITEGAPVFRIYLPLVLRGMGAGVAHSVSATTSGLAYTPLFDSGSIAPGEQFTYTFTLPPTGTLAYPATYAYYSAYSPGRVVGEVVVVQPGETVSETVEMNSAAVISTTTGASLEIGTNVLLTDTLASITEIPGEVLTDTTGTPVGNMHDVSIIGSDHLISGYVTITLPYNPGQLPAGASEEDVRAYYFNGVRWIGRWTGR